MAETPPLLIFVECVATDGPIDASRRKALLDLAATAEFRPEQCVFVTAFHDRDQSPFRQMSTSLAWGSMAWFETEPDHVIHFDGGIEFAGASLKVIPEERLPKS